MRVQTARYFGSMLGGNTRLKTAAMLDSTRLARGLTAECDPGRAVLAIDPAHAWARLARAACRGSRYLTCTRRGGVAACHESRRLALTRAAGGLAGTNEGPRATGRAWAGLAGRTATETTARIASHKASHVTCRFTDAGCLAASLASLAGADAGCLIAMGNGRVRTTRREELRVTAVFTCAIARMSSWAWRRPFLWHGPFFGCRPVTGCRPEARPGLCGHEGPRAARPTLADTADAQIQLEFVINNWRHGQCLSKQARQTSFSREAP
jgi:hypothetical protein